MLDMLREWLIFVLDYTRGRDRETLDVENQINFVVVIQEQR